MCGPLSFSAHRLLSLYIQTVQLLWQLLLSSCPYTNHPCLVSLHRCCCVSRPNGYSGSRESRRGNESVDLEGLQRLGAETWLNDQVINFLASKLSSRKHRTPTASQAISSPRYCVTPQMRAATSFPRHAIGTDPES